MKIELLLLAAGLALSACQGNTNPQQWAMEQLHQEVGLSGGHQNLQCGACHAPGTFAGVDPACESCHLDDFAATTAPNHREAGYATVCAICHNPASWKPARLDHERFGFALEGAHAPLACAACHIGGKFTATPNICADCHQPAYAAAQPDHQAAKFATTCQDCHTSVAWKPSTFDHERSFPLLRGEHRDYRTDCAACHLTPGNYQTFTCTDCHDGTHSQAKMDREHRGEVRDYRYETAACFKCHPQGSKEEGGGDD